MPTTLFTLGYEGLILQQFMQLLKAYKIELLVDVRDLPLSRKKGFSKRPLQLAVTQENKEYMHLKSLGCPPDIRRDYRDDGDWNRYTIRYEAFLKKQVSALQQLDILSREKRCALLCFEADAQHCHRSLITRELVQQWNADLSIFHIFTGDIKKSTRTRLADAAALH